MERFIEMQAQNMEIMMQQRMMDQMENMEDKQERREELKKRRQLQQDLRQQELDLSIQPPRGLRAPLQSSPELSFRSPLYGISTPQAAPTPTPTPQPRPLAPTNLSRTSSPIDIAEEDANILEAFFNWKLQITRNLERRAKWERARKIINDNDWSIRDLQLIEDDSSSMYSRAIKAGLSDGFARGFRDELRAYKLVHRQRQGSREEEAIQALNSLGAV
ncbi:hypothetical protein BJY00DRAFT_320298 [Aspergillus carlsbadensis]|nr:hypothetical protein BJY00DRAFT_320298 [Aspergillus carlsbadensis]